jgi:hypothetical protein
MRNASRRMVLAAAGPASDFAIVQAVLSENKSRRIHGKSVLRPRTAPDGNISC